MKKSKRYLRSKSLSKPAAPLTKKHDGALDESWSKVHAIEQAERRRFDPLIKRFAVLSDERLQSILSSIQQRNDSKPWMKVLIPDLLFELAWVSDLRKAEGSAEEDYLWEDIKRLIAQRQPELGETFRFALWTLYVGRKVGEAWFRRDGKFFERHADLWRALCETSGETKSRAPTNTARICGIAIALYDELKRNPTKKELREQVAARGLIIGAKDWPKYLRKCCLAFLPQSRSGRPKQRKYPDMPDRQSDG